MFIFYISLTLYKLFNNCQVESKGVFLDSCYFCNVSMRCGRRVAGKGVVFSPNCLFPEVVPCLQNLPFYSSLGVLRGSRPKSLWGPWPMVFMGPVASVWPMAVDGTTWGRQRGLWLFGGTTHGCRVAQWLLVGPSVADSVARGCWWHLWLSVGSVVVGRARGYGQLRAAPGSVPFCPPSSLAPARNTL